jgi:protein TonB
MTSPRVFIVAVVFATAATTGSLWLIARINGATKAPPKPKRRTSMPHPIVRKQKPPEPLDVPMQPAAQTAAMAKAQTTTQLRPLTPSALPNLAGIEGSPLGSLAMLPALGTGGLFAATGPAGLATGNADRPARPVSRPSPRYPADARRRGVEGFVVVRLRVSSTGRVEDVVVVKSSPKGVFDEVARDAARRYRFEPAVVGGRQSASTLEQRIVFRLRR